ncbi:hypothetical protein XELAEV_18001736mg [Xenopus laevis]|nr:hypothetical protein XELAEV_18001736mg [Xenopus laevis]
MSVPFPLTLFITFGRHRASPHTETDVFFVLMFYKEQFLIKCITPKGDFKDTKDNCLKLLIKDNSASKPTLIQRE